MRNSTTVLWGSLFFSAALSCSSSGISGGDGSEDSAGSATESVGGDDNSAAGGSDSGGTGETAPTGGVSASGGAVSSGGSVSAGDGGAQPSDLPCEVQNLLAVHCEGCHSKNPPGALLSYDDLMAPGTSDPTRTRAQLVLDRLQATGPKHMPPTPLAAVSADEITAYSSWLAAGAPKGDCGAPAPPADNPYDTPLVCTSGTQWTRGNAESPLMRPGGTCISCHRDERDGPLFAIAGTLFPSAHEPNDCNGAGDPSARVIITAANGTEYTLTPNAAGNFFLKGTIATPYAAKVDYQGRERAMLVTQTDGDCNTCHTEAGTKDAPGRIMLP